MIRPHFVSFTKQSHTISVIAPTLYVRCPLICCVLFLKTLDEISKAPTFSVCKANSSFSFKLDLHRLVHLGLSTMHLILHGFVVVAKVCRYLFVVFLFICFSFHNLFVFKLSK